MNHTHPSIAPSFLVGDIFTLTISGAPNQAVAVIQTANGVTGAQFQFGYTNSAGTFTINGIQTASTAGIYTQIWSVGASAALAFSFTVTASPFVQFTNLTHPTLAPDFEPGDSFRVGVAGPPNQAVAVIQTANGVTGSPFTYGYTDSTGNFSVSGVQPPSGAGIFTQIWSVGGVQATPAENFMVGQPGSGGTISTESLGETSDGHIIGISTLSIGNGQVNTYSLTELDAVAQAYYDSQTVGTLFENGTIIKQGQAISSTGVAGGGLSAVGNNWDHYELQTDHYVIAFLVYGSYFENPFGYEDGSCDDYGDCTIGPGPTPWTPVKSSNPNDWDGKGRFTDQYLYQIGASGQVAFLQNYFATGFIAPGFPALSIPGVTGLAHVSGPTIPLIIISHIVNNSNIDLPACTYWGTQGIFFSQAFIGVNGDHQVANPPQCQ